MNKHILKVQETLDKLLEEYIYFGKGSAKEEKKKQFIKMYLNYERYASKEHQDAYLYFIREGL